MDARERLLALFRGGEPDKVPVWAADQLQPGPQGGWVRRLTKRGLGIRKIAFPYTPVFLPPFGIPIFDGLTYTKVHYIEAGVQKNRHIIETPVGTLSSVDTWSSSGIASNTEEYFVKKTSDWQVVNYIFLRIIQDLAPNYSDIEREEDALGGDGLTVAFIDKTPIQRAWTELASIERAFIDYKENAEEFLQFLDTQRKLHERVAEIVAGSPAEVILINDNITNVISPSLYVEFCQPYYEIYAKALQGTGKTLAVHMDGSLAHLVDEISESPFDVLDSFTIPPVGNLSLEEARFRWRGKILTINCPPHLAWAEKKELRAGYAKIEEAWGSKGFAIVHVEDLPLERVEAHLAAALDAYGYL
jgi:hypothetical protein